MLVDAIRLRHKGAKLAPGSHGPPVRGVLRMSYWRCAGTAAEPAGRIREVQLLTPGADQPPYTGHALPPLQHAEVTRLRAGSMIIVGIEVLHEREERGRWPQAWWCTVVTA